jgi:hypothetical protein
MYYEQLPMAGHKTCLTKVETVVWNLKINNISTDRVNKRYFCIEETE